MTRAVRVGCLWQRGCDLGWRPFPGGSGDGDEEYHFDEASCSRGSAPLVGHYGRHSPEGSSRLFLRWETASLVLLPAPVVTPRGRPSALCCKHECPAKGQGSRPSHPRMASQINTEICRIVELANDRISRDGCASCPVSHPRLKQGQEVRSAPSVNGPYDFP